MAPLCCRHIVMPITCTLPPRLAYLGMRFLMPITCTLPPQARLPGHAFPHAAGPLCDNDERGCEADGRRGSGPSLPGSGAGSSSRGRPGWRAGERRPRQRGGGRGSSCCLWQWQVGRSRGGHLCARNAPRGISDSLGNGAEERKSCVLWCKICCQWWDLVCPQRPLPWNQPFAESPLPLPPAMSCVLHAQVLFLRKAGA